MSGTNDGITGRSWGPQDLVNDSSIPAPRRFLDEIVTEPDGSVRVIKAAEQWRAAFDAAPSYLEKRRVANEADLQDPRIARELFELLTDPEAYRRESEQLERYGRWHDLMRGAVDRMRLRMKPSPTRGEGAVYYSADAYRQLLPALRRAAEFGVSRASAASELLDLLETRGHDREFIAFCVRAWRRDFEPKPTRRRAARAWTAAELRELAEYLPAEPGFLAARFLAPGTLMLLVGKAGTGKTTLSLHLGRCVAGGADFGPLKTKRGSVLVLSCELSDEEMAPLVADLFTEQELRALGDTFRIRCRPDLAPPATIEGIPAFIAALRACVEAEGCPDVVAIDALSDVHRMTENANELMGGLLRAVRDGVAAVLGCAVLLVHHAGKESETRYGMDLLRGASSMRDVPASVFTVEWQRPRDEDGPRRVTLAKGRRRSPGTPRAFTFDIVTPEDGRGLRVEFGAAEPEPATATPDEKADRNARKRVDASLAVQKRLEAALKKTKAPTRALGFSKAKLADLAGVSRNRQPITDAIEALVVQGVLEPVTDDAGNVFYRFIVR